MEGRSDMIIGIISTRRRYYSTDRLMREAAARGHRPVFIDPLRAGVSVSGGGGAVHSHALRASPPDVVIARVGPAAAYMGTAVARQFELAGIPVLNGASSMMRVRDKFGMLQEASAAGLPVPATLLTATQSGLDKQLRMTGGVPVIVKPVQGTQGVGVMLAESPASVRALLEGLWGLKQNPIIQEYVRESRGSDLRVFVLGGRARAAMRRISSRGDFRSNVHRGGKGEKADVRGAAADIAEKTARLFGLEIAGIDLLETGDSFLLLEANASPGIRELEKVTGENVAGMIIDHSVHYAEERRR